MRWISSYQLFLFDLDGLLVNTEELHYRAYKEMLHNRGYDLPWDFLTYFSIAQKDAEAPKRHIYAQFPELQQKEPRWDVLYQEKKRAYLHLLQTTKVPLLPGVQRLLSALEQAKVKRCVVTHSAKLLVEAIKSQNPILSTIPYWITREDYDAPKPAPDGYLKALERYCDDQEAVIGFEDSQRGLRALMATRAKPILVNSIDAKLCETFAKEGVLTFKSIEELLLLEHLPEKSIGR